MNGKVWIVGAGSEAGLITVKGLEAVRGAQVIIYDDLLDHALLEQAHAGCELICVGKRKNSHKKEQEEIHELLIDRARKGLRVVRLKGGDPTVFGRGGEEALALEEAELPYEMVPGVSTCISAPEHFGIPVTHRGMASSFTVVTGHGAGKTAESFNTLAGIRGTLIFLMGHSKAGEIAEGLIKAGMDPETPASVLSRAYMADEKRVDGTLENLGDIAREVQAPAVIVIGKTASMHLEPAEEKATPEVYCARAGASARKEMPAGAPTALIVGTRSFTRKVAAVLREDGIDAREFPCIEVIPQPEEIPEEKELKEYDWLVFTSANGVRIFLEEIDRRRADVRNFAKMKIACIGPGTAAALEEARLYADLVPEEYTTEALADALTRNVRKDEKVLILRAAEGNPLLTNKLENEKILYKDCAVYRTQYSRPEQQSGRPELQKGALSFDRQAADPGRPVTQDADLIIFGSAGGVRAYLENNELGSMQPLCIGALTAAELERLTGKKAVTPDSCSVEGIRQCMKMWKAPGGA
ncbi:MAG: uroporphyrinogen-III C-methyltransferase [Lachnospiraceae bacterium]|nr:uroporphyrinogen-III C-methyltransferase [Lachnospiraceae bacterium]